MSPTRNANKNVSFCSNALRMPSEMWVRWKSNPIATPAFDVWYDVKTGDIEFDKRFRNDSTNKEFGQLTHTNNKCNDSFKVVLSRWRETYGTLHGELFGPGHNRFPVFFDMEQSANVLALASWYIMPEVD